MNIADYLRECGYQVIEAASAGEALQIFSTDTAIDLLFTDVQMPGEMDGFGLARWVRKHRPGVRVVITSGYAKAAEEARDLCDEGPIVGKPYDLVLLLDRIRRTLGAAPAERSGRSCA